MTLKFAQLFWFTSRATGWISQNGENQEARPNLIQRNTILPQVPSIFQALSLFFLRNASTIFFIVPLIPYDYTMIHNFIITYIYSAYIYYLCIANAVQIVIRAMRGRIELDYVGKCYTYNFFSKTNSYPIIYTITKLVAPTTTLTTRIRIVAE